MPYHPMMVQPMKDEVTRLGVKELVSVAAVDAVLGDQKGTALIFVNSVCGCAAGMARPALAKALQHGVKPDAVYTVFAGQDVEATARARSYFADFQPSSPSFMLVKDGEMAKMVHRYEIEGRSAEVVAAALIEAFDAHCAVGAEGRA
ncbi:MAG: BrxA/BrxB family bacilliredoxin [Gemmatimonadales bacterium]